MTPLSSHDAALEAFCEQQQSKLIGTLTLYCGDRALGEELAQEALARLCLRWSQIARMQSPEAWLHRVGINLANSYFRRRLIEYRANRRLATRAQSPRTETDDAETVAIRQVMAALPRRQRAALILRYYADLKVTEVAELMGCPESTVKTLSRRGIQRLRTQLAPEYAKELRDAP